MAAYDRPTANGLRGFVYVVTPWKYVSERDDVKRQLYREHSNGQDDHGVREAQQAAVDTVAMWAMKGNLPHAVESTALLVAAQLHAQAVDEGVSLKRAERNGTSLFSVQATYATAFCRFINGYCDNYLARQLRKPMLEVAQELEMPALWIELRHEATHGKLPSVVRLEQATRDGLLWLWEHYWATLETEVAENLPTEATHGQIHEVLTAFVKKRVAEVRQKADHTLPTSASAKACIELVTLCRGRDESLVILSSVLVEPKMLIPADRRYLSGLRKTNLRSNDSMEGAFLLWLPLLRALTRYQQKFLPCLLAQLTRILAQPVLEERPTDGSGEALYKWTVYLLDRASSAYSPPGDVTLADLRFIVMEECLMAPETTWTRQLKRTLYDEAKDSLFRERFRNYMADILLLE